MASTTLLKRRNQMDRKPFPECHGGQGELDWTNVLARPDTDGHLVRYIHDDLLPPGVTIGEHEHKGNEEYYLILSGQGVMTLDGEPHEVGPGDVAAVFPGGSHGLANTGDEVMRILVVCAAAPA